MLEGETAVMIPILEGIMLKHELNPMRNLRDILRHKMDMEKASRFIKKIRGEWRLE